MDLHEQYKGKQEKTSIYTIHYSIQIIEILIEKAQKVGMMPFLNISMQNNFSKKLHGI